MARLGALGHQAVFMCCVSDWVTGQMGHHGRGAFKGHRSGAHIWGHNWQIRDGICSLVDVIINGHFGGWEVVGGRKAIQGQRVSYEATGGMVGRCLG